MIRSFLLILFLLFGLCEQSQAHQVERNPSPQYVFSISDNQSGLQDADVQILFWILNQHFQSEISNPDKSWTAGYDWEISYIGAGANFDGRNFTVMLWGGFVRARFMNMGALAATLCHELGHKLGGPPYQKFPGSDPHWSSAEGQSDYFAATRCLPKVYESLKTHFPEKLQNTMLDDFSLELCKDSENFDQCRWVAQAGVDLIEFLQVYYDLQIPLASPQAWVTEEVKNTLFTAYPSYQCRMDIFKAGAREPNSPRLRCWFVEQVKD